MRGTKAARLFGMALALCALGAMLGAGSAAAAISGTVTHGSTPIEGIEVCAEPAGPVGSGGCARTDSNGKYLIPGVGAGDLVHFYSRNNAAPGYAPQWYPGKPSYEEAEPVTEAEITSVGAQLELGGTVRGKVVNVGTSIPIEGVEVCPDPTPFRDREVTYCSRTDSNGEYALRGLLSAGYRFEFRTAGDVNYVEEVTPARSIVAGTESILEAGLVPGVEIKGTLTEAGTGLPVEGLMPPFSTPLVCALDSETEAQVKCAWVGSEGKYSIPGLRPGPLYAVSFAVDNVEEGLDLDPDGYVRQYWDGVQNFSEATLITGSGRSVFAGVDAVLSRGEEVWPNCELASACEWVLTSEEEQKGEGPPGGTNSTPNGFAGASVGPVPVPPLLRAPAQPRAHCGKGFVKVDRVGRTRCVKITKPRNHHKRRHHHHRTTKRHR